MPVSPDVRKMTVIAQDPSLTVESDGQRKILTTQLTIPYESLARGPRGHRVMVVDYDASRRVMYRSAEFGPDDEFEKAPNETLLQDPKFHAQNVYAIIMWLLARFEFALGRRVSWGFGGPQLYVSPHAFHETNAYYSEDAHGLLFGYFRGAHSDEWVHTCLSHDIICHEATHALLDGLRDSYDFPSGPDQAAFHEGFADTIALLSVFAHQEVVEAILRGPSGSKDDSIPITALRPHALRETALSKFAEEFGKETGSPAGDALRHAANATPHADALDRPEYQAPHRRGVVLSAAAINAFLGVWHQRLNTWVHGLEGDEDGGEVSLERAAEDGCDAAMHLLTMAIRALDYCPVVDITFGDFLSALLTADYEVLPSDGKHGYRKALINHFAAWGIRPASRGRRLSPDLSLPETGIWERPEHSGELNYRCVHRESLQQDPEEVFRFIWENRDALGVSDRSYTRVVSVRPCIRTAPDGFVLRETVCEYQQIHDVLAGHLSPELGIRRPGAMPDDTPVRVYGGGVLMFDEFGRLKYHVRSRLANHERQERRLRHLWTNNIKDGKGKFGASDGIPRGRRFAVMHERRAGIEMRESEWE